MIRWGIIGAGRIADRFASSLAYEKDAQLYAISGRNEEKLRAFQEKHPCEKVLTGYEGILADEAVDAVYIALPHHMHREWSVRALQAHKAVLCEKPAVLDEAEMLAVISAARKENTLYMEAMKPRFTPGYRKLKEILRAGRTGKVCSVYAEHCSLFPEEKAGMSYHTEPGKGGCLLDTGCYCVNLMADLLSGMPEVKEIRTRITGGVDWYVDAKLAFEDGEGQAVCAFDRKRAPYARITCENAVIEVQRPHRPDVLRVCFDDGRTEEYAVPYEHDDFFSQIRHFDELLQNGMTQSGVMSFEDSLRVIRIMDRIRSSFPGEEPERS